MSGKAPRRTGPRAPHTACPYRGLVVAREQHRTLEPLLRQHLGRDGVFFLLFTSSACAHKTRLKHNKKQKQMSQVIGAPSHLSEELWGQCLGEASLAEVPERAGRVGECLGAKLFKSNHLPLPAAGAGGAGGGGSQWWWCC
jgi:hypothetical protein